MKYTEFPKVWPKKDDHYTFVELHGLSKEDLFFEGGGHTGLSCSGQLLFLSIQISAFHADSESL